MNTQHTVIVNFVVGRESGKFVMHQLGQRRSFDVAPRWDERIMFRTANGTYVVGHVVEDPLHDIDGHVNVHVAVIDDDGKFGDPVELGITDLVRL